LLDGVAHTTLDNGWTVCPLPSREAVASRPVRFSYDPEADAASLHLVEGSRSAKQVVVDDDELWKPIVIDLDGEGHVIGFEFLDAAESLPASLLDPFR